MPGPYPATESGPVRWTENEHLARRSIWPDPPQPPTTASPA